MTRVRPKRQRFHLRVDRPELSMLCFKAGSRITRRSSWTTRPELVTCERCRAILGKQKEA